MSERASERACVPAVLCFAGVLAESWSYCTQRVHMPFNGHSGLGGSGAPAQAPASHHRSRTLTRTLSLATKTQPAASNKHEPGRFSGYFSLNRTYDANMFFFYFEVSEKVWPAGRSALVLPSRLLSSPSLLLLAAGP